MTEILTRRDTGLDVGPLRNLLDGGLGVTVSLPAGPPVRGRRHVPPLDAVGTT